MCETMTEFLQHPAVHGALVGALTAAKVDLSAFRAWRSVHDFAVYDWRTATFRWVQGAILGALTAAGLGSF